MPASEAQKTQRSQRAAWSMKPGKARQKAPQLGLRAPLDPLACLHSARLERLLVFRDRHPSTFAAFSDETRQEVDDYQRARARDRPRRRSVAPRSTDMHTAMGDAAR